MANGRQARSANTKTRSTMKGRFIPKNPAKYVGNPNAIFFRSSWEVTFLKWLDMHPSVIQWASEELAIPYKSPVDNLVHRYYPDFIVIYRDTSGAVRKEIVEIKPYHETVLGRNPTPQNRMIVAVNQAKWEAAAMFAASQGATFRVITEKSIFRKQGQTPTSMVYTKDATAK
jgi:hypothetical protein